MYLLDLPFVVSLSNHEREISTNQVSIYARGVTTRDIQSHLEEMYGVDVSPTLISQVTEAVTEEVRLWQNRPLDDIYPIVYLDAVRIKVKHNGSIITKAVYLAIAVTMDGVKDVFGMWAAENEGAKFWLAILTELKNRGVLHLILFCMFGRVCRQGKNGFTHTLVGDRPVRIKQQLF